MAGQGSITSPNSSTTTVIDLGVGENIFEWTVSNGPCSNGVTSDRVSIFIFDQNNTQVDAGNDQDLCSPVPSTFLQASPVIFPAVGTWTLLSGSGTIVDVNSPTTEILDPGVGENVFEWSVVNGPCESGAGSDIVVLRVFDENNPVADAGPDQEHCSPDIFTVQLNGSPVTFPALGTWTLVSGTGTIANVNDPTTTVFDIAIGESVFLWTVDNGPCATGITTDEVRVRIFDENNPDAAAGDDQSFCTPVSSAALNGSPVTFPAIGTWTVLSGSGSVVDPGLPGTTITGLTPGVTVVEWTVGNGPCANGTTSDQLQITLFDANNPLADAGPDQELCTPTGTTTASALQGSNVIFPAVGTWTLVGGTGDIADPNDPNSPVTDLGVGENVFLWTVLNGECAEPISADIMTIRVYDENNSDADAGPDQQICTPVTNAFMNGGPVIFPAIGTWTLVSGQGTIVDPNDPETEVTDLGIGINIFAWTVDNGACANGVTSDEVTLVLFDAQAPPANAGPDQELCAPDESAALVANAPVGSAQGQWSIVQGVGVVDAGSSPNAVITGLQVGETILTWTISSGDCITTVDSISIFVFDPTNADAFAGLDQELCVPQDSAFMAASTLIFPATGIWSVISGAGTPVAPNDPGTLISGLATGVNVFQWEVYNGPCFNSPTTDQVTITLYSDSTSAANAGPDLETCLPATSVNLQGEQPIAPGAGTWTLLSGGGTIVDPNDPNTQVTGLPQGESIFVWTLEWDPCPNNGLLTDTMTVRVFDPFAPAADAGPDQELCTPQSSTTLAGNVPATPGVGTWTVVTGSAVVTAPNDANSTVTGLTVGVHVLVWTINNGDCGFGPPSNDTLQIRVFDGEADLAQAGGDISLCTPQDNSELVANVPVFPAVGTWTVVSGTAAIADPADPLTTVSGLGVGEVVLRWTIDNGACGSTSDDISVFIFDGSSAAADAGDDATLCLPETDAILGGNGPVFPASGSWEVVEGGAVLADAADPATAVSGLTLGPNTFRWTIVNGPCGTTSDEVTILVYSDQQEAANAGGDQQLCTPASTAALAANSAIQPATGAWTVVSGTAAIADPSDPLTTVSGLGVGEVVLRWTIDNGACGSSSDDISVFIFDGSSAAADAGDDATLCLPTTTTILGGNGPVFPASGSWEVVEGGAVLADAADPATAVSGLTLGPNTFRWTIVNGPCGTTSDEVTILVYSDQQEAANAGGDQQLCTPASTAALAANSAIQPATGAWTVVSGTAAIADPSDPLTTVSGLGVGEVVLRWTIDNGPCAGGPTSDEVIIRVYDNSIAPASAGPDQSFCTPIGEPVTMFASGAPAPATGTWALASGQGALADDSDPFSAVTGLALGSNVFRWTIDNGACGSTSDEVELAVFDSTVPPADAGLDQEFCQDVSSTFLEALPASSTATGSWARLAGSGILSDVNDAGSGVTGMQLGSNWFTWTISNGPCPASVDSVMIFIRDCLTINIPDAYSPNGDGVNDIFRITNIESYPGSSFQVFNRWGSKVLDQSPYANDWDGTGQFGSAFGEQLPESTYYYVLDLGDGSEAYTGYIYLRR